MHIGSRSLARLLEGWSLASGPAHRRLSDFLRLLILDGRLSLGLMMPGERELAVALGVSRTTVATAYATLREQGYLDSKERSRSVTRIPRPHREPDSSPSAERGIIDFSTAAPPAPGQQLHDAFEFALGRLPGHLPGYGYSSLGLPELREAIALRYETRGLPTDPSQILVTNGALHALGLVVRLLLRPRSRVVVDHPSYPHALDLLRDAGCRLLPIAVTPDGWDVERLAEASVQADLAYLQPDFHNPTGLHLAAADQQRLVLGCPVIVDETTAELALDVPPTVPFAVHHPSTITIGSASKTFWGGLRIGWIRADAKLIARLAQSRATSDLGTPIVEQLACARLMAGIDEVLPSRLAELRERRAALLELLGERLPEWSVGPSVGGLSVWARLPAPLSSALAALGPRFGVQVAAGPRFGVGGAFERNIRLPYSLDRPTMEAGIDALAAAWASVTRGDRDAPQLRSVI